MPFVKRTGFGTCIPGIFTSLGKFYKPVESIDISYKYTIHDNFTKINIINGVRSASSYKQLNFFNPFGSIRSHSIFIDYSKFLANYFSFSFS